MTLKNNRSSLLCYFKLYASFRSHWWIQSGVTVRKRPIWVKFDDFQSRLTLKFDGWPWTRQIWGIWKLRPAYSLETPNLGQNQWCFVPCDLEIWWMTLENNRASLLCCFKLCATFHSHWWIQTGVTVRKRPIWVKFDRFLEPCHLEIWWMTLKNNRAPLLCYFKLYASFRSHWWILAGVTVRKRPIWVKIDNFLAVWPCNLTYDLEKQ